MTMPQGAIQGQPGFGGQPQPQGQPNGVPAGHIPMPPGMGAFDASQVGAQPRGAGFSVSQLPPVQQQGGQQAPMGQPAQQIQQQPAAQPWNPWGQPQPQQQQAQPQQPVQPQAPVQQQFQSHPQQPQQQPQQLQVSPQTVLDGPELPPELRGRTMAEVVGIYNGLRNVALRNLPQQQQAPQTTPVPPTQQQASVQPQQQQQAQGQMSAADFFRDPAGHMRRIVREEAGQMLAPVYQQTMTQGVQQIHSAIAREVGPQFAHIEADVLNYLRGVDPQALMNPEVWRLAVRTAVGDRVLQGRQTPLNQPQGQQQPIQQGATPAGRFPVQQQNGNPLPNLGSFWSEPSGSAPVNQGGVALSPEEQQAAQLMNMSFADYAAWKSGVPRRA